MPSLIVESIANERLIGAPPKAHRIVVFLPSFSCCHSIVFVCGKLRRLRESVQGAIRKLVRLTRCTANQLFSKLAKGEVSSHFFGAAKFNDIAKKAIYIFPSPQARPEDLPQKISIQFLEEVLRAAGGSRQKENEALLTGVRLGVTEAVQSSPFAQRPSFPPKDPTNLLVMIRPSTPGLLGIRL